MNWPRGLAIAVLTLAIATFLLVVLGVTIIVQIDRTIDAQTDAQTRAVCVSETYAPFFQTVAQALVDLDADGGLQPGTSAALIEANTRLATINDRCPT